MNRCCDCNLTTEAVDSLYKYKDNLYCYDCLLEKFENDSICTEVKFFIDEDGREIGVKDDPDELLKELHEIVDFEEIKE